MFEHLNSREFANLYRHAVDWFKKSFEAFMDDPTPSARALSDDMAGLLQELEDERQFRHAQ